jgi:hypothetical protein
LQEHRYTAQALLETLTVTFHPPTIDNALADPISETPLMAPLREDIRTRSGSDGASSESHVQDAVGTTAAENNPVALSDVEEIVHRVGHLRGSDAALRASSAEILVRLARDEHTEAALASAGDMALWMRLLAAGTDAGIIVAARALKTLAKRGSSNQVVTGEQEATALLVKALKKHTTDQVKEEALDALSNLAVNPMNSWRMLTSQLKSHCHTYAYQVPVIKWHIRGRFAFTHYFEVV